jgi:hypothetical protein
MTFPLRVAAKFAGVPAATHAVGNVSGTAFERSLEPDAFTARTLNV